MQCTLERSFLGVNIGCQSLKDLDYADDVALLAELLHILANGLGVMSEEASLLGLQVNLAKTKVQSIGNDDSVPQVVHVVSTSCATCDGSSESEILRRIGICQELYDAAGEACLEVTLFWVETKVRLYHVLPVFMYGSEAWTIRMALVYMMKSLARRLDAFDTWSHRKILRIPYTNASIRQTAGCPPVSCITKIRSAASLATWHVHISGKIITEVSVRRSVHDH